MVDRAESGNGPAGSVTPGGVKTRYTAEEFRALLEGLPPPTEDDRTGLIKRGLCYAPRHGELTFTVPMFDEFIRRALT